MMKKVLKTLTLLVCCILYSGVWGKEYIPLQATEKQYCDVNGDGKKEIIYIEYTTDYKNKFYIKDSTNKTVLCAKDFMNYDKDRLFTFADFNKDGVLDILIYMSLEGSGGFYDYGIYSFKENKLVALKSMVDTKNKIGDIYINDINTKCVEVYVPTYKKYMEISSIKQNKKIIIDITNPDTPQEKLPSSSFDNLPGSVHVCDYNNDGRPDLRVVNHVLGESHGDILAKVVTYYTYKNSKWNQIGVEINSYYPKVKNIPNYSDVPDFLNSSITAIDIDKLFNITYGQLIEKYGTEYLLGDSGIGSGYLFKNTKIIVGFDNCQPTKKSDKLRAITICDNGELSILGIRTGMNLKEVVKILGEPTSKGTYEVTGGVCARYQLKGYSLLLLFNNDFSKMGELSLIKE